MRKFCYLMMAVLVTLAAGAYFAADRCLRHPDSLVGRSTLAAYRSVGNPIYSLCRSVGTRRVSTCLE